MTDEHVQDFALKKKIQDFKDMKPDLFNNKIKIRK